MKRLLMTVLICGGMIQSTLSSNFDEEKALIDAHGPATFAQHIGHIYDFTVTCVTDPADERFNGQPFDLALHQLGLKQFDKAPQVPKKLDMYAFNIIYGGLQKLNQYRQTKDPSSLLILEAAEVASVLLSPEVFIKDYSFGYPGYGIYKQGLLNRSKLYYTGLYYREAAEEILMPKLKEIVESKRRPRDGYNIACKFFTPMVFTGEKAIFSERAYLYALSKGIILYGLENKFAAAHGFLFKLPVVLFPHDQAHFHDLLMPTDDETKTSDADYEAVAKIVKNLAGQLYTLIYVQPVIKVEDQPKASRAAFYMFHENKVFECSEFLLQTRVWGGMKEAFKVLKIRLDQSLGFELNKVDSVRPPSTMSEEEKKLAQFVAQMQLEEDKPKDTFNFLERFASDLVYLIVDVYKDERVGDVFPEVPENEADQSIEQWVFGTEADSDRTRIYHGPRALELNLKLVQWFSDQFADKIK